MIQFDCPSCGKHFSFSDRFAGRNMICAECKSEIVVPNTPPPPSDVPSPPPPPAFDPDEIVIDASEPDLPIPPPPPNVSPAPPPLPEPTSTTDFSGFTSSSGFDGFATQPPDDDTNRYEIAAATPMDGDSAILAYVFEEKFQEQNTPTAPVTERTVPKEEEPRNHRLFVGLFVTALLLVLAGIGAYLILYVDWRGPDPRIATLDQVLRLKNDAIVAAKNKETESQTNRFLSLETWNRVGELIDAFVTTLGEQDDKQLDLADMEEMIRFHSGDENMLRQLTPRRDEALRSLQGARERMTTLRTQIEQQIQTANHQERETDTTLRDARIRREEAAFYEKQETELQSKIRDLPGDRSPVSIATFDADRVSVEVENVIDFQADWTEYYFINFTFPGTNTERFYAAYDGSRRMAGLKSLRITSQEKTPIAIRFPNDPGATRLSPAKAGYFSFSLRFPDIEDPILIGHDPNSGKIGDIRIRLGNEAGTIDYQTISPRYCEAIYYDARGKFFALEFPLDGDTFWTRTDRFDPAKLEQPDEGFGGVPVESAGGDPADREESPTTKFLSQIDWVEIRLSPLANRTTLWIDGISFSEKRTRPVYDLLRSETLQAEARKREREHLNRKRSRQPALTSPGGRPPSRPAPRKDDEPIDFIDQDEEEETESPPNTSSSATNVPVPRSDPPVTGAPGSREQLVRWMVQDAGGQVRIRLRGELLTLDGRSRIPDSLEQGDIEEINIAGCKELTEARLEQIASQTRLKRLDLSRTGLNDASAAKLSALTSLESLHLEGNDLTFKALNGLRTMTQLRELNLDGIRPSTDGINALSSLTGLRLLVISRSGLNFGDLIHIITLDDLETLDVSSTNLGDRGVQTLKINTSLRNLNLSKTRITDAGLRLLESLQKLRILDISETAVTNRCLEDIGKARNLEQIVAINTGITREGILQTLGTGWVGKFQLAP